MKISFPHLFICGLMAAPVLSLAQSAPSSYSTNFTSADGFTSGYNVSQDYTTIPTSKTGEWVTTDANQGDTVLPSSAGLVEFAHDQWGMMGGNVNITNANPNGLAPAATPGGTDYLQSAELWYPVNVANTFYFQSEFVVEPDTDSYDFPTNDTYGFTFRDTDGALLTKILMVPDTINPATQMDVEWVNAQGTVTNTGWVLDRQAIYNIVVSANMSGAVDTFNAQFDPLTGTGGSTGTSEPFSGTLSSGDVSLGEAGFTWQPQTLGTPSADYMVFNNYTVAAVPEPGTLALILLSLMMLGLVNRVRRHRA
jgi:hypothetical protein